MLFQCDKYALSLTFCITVVIIGTSSSAYRCPLAPLLLPSQLKGLDLFLCEICMGLLCYLLWHGMTYLGIILFFHLLLNHFEYNKQLCSDPLYAYVN